LKAFLPGLICFFAGKRQKITQNSENSDTKSHFLGDFYQKITFCKKQAGSLLFSLTRIGFLALPPLASPKTKKRVQIGFLPFHNLICTYEQDLQNPARIIELIDMYLLK